MGKYFDNNASSMRLSSMGKVRQTPEYQQKRVTDKQNFYVNEANNWLKEVATLFDTDTSGYSTELFQTRAKAADTLRSAGSSLLSRMEENRAVLGDDFISQFRKTLDEQNRNLDTAKEYYTKANPYLEKYKGFTPEALGTERDRIIKTAGEAGKLVLPPVSAGVQGIKGPFQGSDVDKDRELSAIMQLEAYRQAVSPDFKSPAIARDKATQIYARLKDSPQPENPSERKYAEYLMNWAENTEKGRPKATTYEQKIAQLTGVSTPVTYKRGSDMSLVMDMSEEEEGAYQSLIWRITDALVHPGTQRHGEPVKQKYNASILEGETDPLITIYAKTVDDPKFIEWYNNDYRERVARNLDDVYLKTLGRYMRADESLVYQYLRDTENFSDFDTYRTALEPVLSARANAGAASDAADMAKEYPVLSSLASSMTNFAGGITGTIDSLKSVLEGKPIDPGNDMQAANAVTQGIRSGVKEEYIDSKDIKFLYDVAMSVLDNIVNMRFGGALGTAVAGAGATATQASNAISRTISTLMGSQVASQAVVDGKIRGYSDEKALALGIVRGTIEGITEKYSIDAILNNPSSFLAKHIKNGFVRSAVAEGSEEVAANWLNGIVDIVADTDRNILIENYKKARNELKYDEEAALTYAIVNAMGEDAKSFAAGALSGGGMFMAHNASGFVADTIDKATPYINNKSTELDIDMVNRLIEEGLTKGTGTEAYKISAKVNQKIQAEFEKAVAQGISAEEANARAIKKVSRADFTQLQQAVMSSADADFEVSVKKRLEELGEKGDTTVLVQAIYKKAQGIELSSQEKSALKNSKYGQRVLNEYENAGTEGYADNWTEDIDGAYDRETFGRKKTVAPVGESAETQSKTVAVSETPLVTKAHPRGVAAEIKGKDAAGITGIASKTETETVLSTSKGDTVKASDVTFDDPFIQDIMEQIESDYDTNTANAVFEAAQSYREYKDGKVGAGSFLSAFDTLYRVAEKEGLEFSSAMNRVDLIRPITAIGTTAARSAMNAGLVSYEARYQAKEAAQKVNKKTAATKKATVTVGKDIKVSKGVENTLERIAALAKADVVVENFSEGDESRGYYVDGVIHLNAKKVSDSASVYVAIHEVVHHLKANNAKGYSVLEKYITNYLSKKGHNVDNMVKALQKSRQKYGEKLSYEDALEELVCNTMSEIATDEEAMAVFLELNESERKTLISVLRDIANKIREWARSLTGKEYRRLVTESETLRHLANELNKQLKGMKIKENTADSGVKYSREFAGALTSAEWKKYNYAMISNVDAGLRVSDHSILVECENGQFSYKLVVYDNRTQDNNILAIYGIGENLYNEDISNFDQKIIGEFLTKLEDKRYDNKQMLERILRSYSKNVGYILWRYNSRSHRFNKYGRKIPQSRGIVQQQYNGRGVHQSSQTIGIKRKSHSDETDSAYMKAVESGDTETAQRLVDEAAKRVGYTLKRYHQTEGDFTEFDTERKGAGRSDELLPSGIYLKSTDSDIGLRGKKQMSLYVKTENTLRFTDRQSASEYWKNNIDGYSEIMESIKAIDTEYKRRYEQSDAEADRKDSELWKKRRSGEISEAEYQAEIEKSSRLSDALLEEWGRVSDEKRAEAKTLIDNYLRTSEYDSVALAVDEGSFGRKTDTLIVFDSSKVKSADAVTYDDSGEVIPLSDRFDSSKRDIRYSYADEEVDLWGMLEPEEETAESTQRSEYLEGFVQTAATILEKTRGVTLADGRMRGLANNVIRRYTGKFNTPLAQQVEDILTVATANESVSGYDVVGEIAAVMKKAITESEYTVDQFRAEREDVFNIMRGFGRIYLSEEQMSNLKDNDRSLVWFRGKLFGRVMVVSKDKFTQYSAAPLEEMYRHLAQEYPEWFDKDVPSILMPMELLRQLEALRPRMVGFEEVYMQSADEVAVQMASDLLTRVVDAKYQANKTEELRTLRRQNSDSRKKWLENKDTAESIKSIERVTATLRRRIDRPTKTDSIPEEYREPTRKLLDSIIVVPHKGIPYKKTDTENLMISHGFNTESGMASDMLKPYDTELYTIIRKKGGIVVTNPEVLRASINTAFDNPSRKTTLYFGLIDEGVLSRIEKSVPNIPKELRGTLFKIGSTYSLTATMDSIRHIVQDKGLSRDDVYEFLSKYAEVVTAFDTVTFDYYRSNTGQKEKGLLFKKTFEDGSTQSFTIISNKSKSLSLKTIYMEKGDYEKRKSAQTLPMSKSPAHTPIAEESQTSDISIDSESLNVKSNLAVSLNEIATMIEHSISAKDTELLFGLPDADPYLVSEMRWFANNVTANNIYDMSNSEIWFLSSILNRYRNYLLSKNRIFQKELADNLISLGDRTIEEFDAVKKDKRDRLIYKGKPTSFVEKALSAVDDLMRFDTADAFTYAKMLGETGGSIIYALYRGQLKAYENIREIQKWTDDNIDLSYVKELRKKAVLVMLDSGVTIALTIPQVMEIYVLSRRYQAEGHLYGGGIQAEMTQVVKNLLRKSKKDSIEFSNSDIETITPNDVDRILKELDKAPGAKQLAEKLQEYLSDEIAELGNEVTMKKYGYRGYITKNYWPIDVVETSKDTTDKSVNQNSLYNITHPGFSHHTKEGASEAIVIHDIFTTFAKHCGEMATMNGLAIPLSDALKWYNYRNGKKKIKESMTNAFSIHAREWFEKFLLDLNNQTKDESENQIIKWLTRNAKASAIWMKGRVAIQQGSSYLRASALISPTHLFNPNVLKKGGIRNSKKYCTIAWWKANGFYTTDIGQSIEKIILPDSNYYEKGIEVGFKVAGWNDQLTLGVLWNACENQVVAEHKSLKRKTEECNLKTAELLTRVVNETQVVDTPFHRTQMRRKKTVSYMLLTAFMDEPLKNYNMMRNSKSVRDFMKRAFSFMLSAAACAAFETIWDVVASLSGDDKEDKTLTEKIIEQYLDNLSDNLNPLNLHPFISKVYSIIDGWSTSAGLDEIGITTLVSSIKHWIDRIKGESDRTVYSDIYETAKAISYLTGIGVHTVIKDFTWVVNWWRPAGQKLSNTAPTKTKLAQEAVNSLLAGDRKQYGSYYKDLMEKCGGKEADVDKLIYSALSKTEEAQSARAAYNSGTKEYEEKIHELVKKGFKFEIVLEAINGFENFKNAQLSKAVKAEKEGDLESKEAELQKLYDTGLTEKDIIEEYNELLEKNESESEKIVLMFDTEFMVNALETGDIEWYNEIVEYLKNNNVSPETMKTKITKTYKSSYVEAYLNGEAEEQERIKGLLETTGFYEDLGKTLTDWVVADLKEQYLASDDPDERAKIRTQLYNTGKWDSYSELDKRLKKWRESE